MMELNKILSDGRWGDMAALVNANFEKIKVELMKIRFASILTFCKGYFSTESRLLAKFPTGKTGEYAFVGTPWPGTVWEWADTKWVDTKVAPQLGESIFLELLKQHIDNTTILWDDTGKYIYSLGGSGNTCTIAVSIDTSGIGKCTVEATGDKAIVKPSEDGAAYTVTAVKGTTVTVKIVPSEGYKVQKLNVDKVSQGAVPEYTFEKLDADHTMYVWMEAVEEIPTEFLERSDLPGNYYSSTQDALNAVRASYPDGLTQDVTITCVKQATERRMGGVWIASLSEWNMRSMYCLTIDGADLLTYDGKSLGCLSISNVDNVIFRDILFSNYANGVEASTPGDNFALMCKASNNLRMNNIYVDNCIFDGTCTQQNDRMAYSATSFVDVDNVTFNGCTLTKNFGWAAMSFSGCSMVSLIKNHISLDYTDGVSSHSVGVIVSDGRQLMFEDNYMTGNNREAYVSISNVDRIYLRRNKMISGGGQAVSINHIIKTGELVIESNLFRGMLNGPSGGWIKYYINPGNVRDMSLNNNTFYMDGAYYEQYATRFGNVDRLELFNNILVKAADHTIHAYSFDTIGELFSGNNIYEFEYDADKGASSGILLWTEKNYSIVQIPFNISHQLGDIQKLDYEKESVVVPRGSTLLNAGYAIVPSYDTQYPADGEYVPWADVEYKCKSVGSNSRGCFNLHGNAVDETENPAGYTGFNLSTSTPFSDASQYSAMAESILVFTHASLDRRKFVRFSIIGSAHKYLVCGKYAMLSAWPVIDSDGEYVSDELYTIKID